MPVPAVQFLFLSLSLSAPALLAQSIQVDVPNPITLSAQAGASQQSTTVSAGPAAQMFAVSAAAGTGATATQATLMWRADAWASHFGFDLLAMLTVGTAQPAQASVASGEFLLSLTLPSPTDVVFTLDREILGPAGSPVPQIRIDIGDDGVFELTESTGGPWSPIAVTLGPTPLLVRCTIASTLAVPGTARARLQFTVLPRQTYSYAVSIGCTGTSFFVAPRFDGDLDLFYNPQDTEPVVAVLGLGWQPVTLSPGCVLLPSPDVLVLLMPFAPPPTVTIPPAARPVQFGAQGVAVESILRVTNAHWVFAM